MKNISVLGSTGSIGTQTLEIVRENPELHVRVLACGSRIDLVEKQIREFHPDLCAVYDEKAARELKVKTADLPVKILSGMDGLEEAASYEPVEIVLTSMVGMIGIKPTIAAIRAGKDIALANKETLVTAGHLIIPMAKENHVKILPVDSEHSAIFQSLKNEDPRRLEKILLTASGGPFRGKKREELKQMRSCDALKHPNWSMGKKITVDSATLVNKGLEVMEARWLFDVELDQIEVVVHPQSVIHSMVQFVDGAVIAQLGIPDMKLPIRYALFYPDRIPSKDPRLDFYELGKMTFEKPDPDTFTGLSLALKAAKTGGTMPTVFNAANEKAVALFLKDEIGFLEIPDLIGAAMDAHRVIASPDVEAILQAETETYAFLEELRNQ
ncbi:MAG: 1-deoxy-D-xylulose-5-phosphate reductoisomerase [Lachnospiraceae bacterium]|nr:1-deoxy-D-xylulose-5-phosphate reductoisomerase [Lachnospiraceae bacterium]